MSLFVRYGVATCLALALIAGCTREHASPVEVFTWCDQAVSFAPPPPKWRREGDNGGGTLGVRFVLSGGGGQCISVAAYTLFAERDRRKALARLISRRDSLSEREFLNQVSMARARTEDPFSDREGAACRAINAALDRAGTDYLDGSHGFAEADLETALRVASSYQPTLAELLPRLRLVPERQQEPERWRIGRERDTTLSGVPAFASDDTLITPERPLLYHQVFWVVNGVAFNATFQGMPENLPVFDRVVGSIEFPESTHVAVR